ncbi:hypothetical protein BDZ94DRAFT_1314875 [Collybia nuda]|uniref:Retroviral polymerase SH3-like domain-containing protein n=1 Tax=Collybia nuda TaxID=64659 RepID=A0A9P5XU09_9AGAR|nr:hypothetical protein BDZ94DRAFT_1314875 [Collybia nuda]
MEKCVFIGYPAGYKGWLFYNPTTKKTIISERAEFDEQYFPGLRQPPCPSAPPPPLPIVNLKIKTPQVEQDSELGYGPDFGGDDDISVDMPNLAPNPVADENAPPAAFSFFII